MVIKKILVAGFLCTCVAVTHVLALDLPGEITQALANGDAKTISKYFNSSVELNFSESKGVYGKSQAEQILKNFFNNNGAFDNKGTTKYLYKQHHNSDRDNAQYYIGELYTGKGIYRIYIFMKNKFIHEMRIENND